jgi:hypothetical protein
VSVLLPEGVPLLDAPWNLVEAINAGLTFLSFMEMGEDEQPPREIWLNGEALTEHFAQVKLRREEKYGIDGRREIDGPVSTNADKFWADG